MGGSIMKWLRTAALGSTCLGVNAGSNPSACVTSLYLSVLNYKEVIIITMPPPRVVESIQWHSIWKALRKVSGDLSKWWLCYMEFLLYTPSVLNLHGLFNLFIIKPFVVEPLLLFLLLWDGWRNWGLEALTNLLRGVKLVIWIPVSDSESMLSTPMPCCVWYTRWMLPFFPSKESSEKLVRWLRWGGWDA